MSDYSNLYSNLIIEKADDLPPPAASSGSKAKSLSPSNVLNTLPFLPDLTVGETIKLEIPADSFGYKINDDYPVEHNKHFYSLKSALFRSFDFLAKSSRGHFVYRVLGKELYIKRVGE